MSFTTNIDTLIRQYEIYIVDFPEHILIFRLILSELKILRTEFFKDIVTTK